ncbi:MULTISPECIES: chemotaxis protein CheA [Sphingobium]|jgi:two-component system chemotaxis sensor kinase CheA|uniref:Chemotaxis protein CheA n=1 Tax=Sphingobium fuliginis ATCC 27551 TaxID=1208342 RepID=A0A5B8CN71_SPHSA|nr:MULTISPECIES: chemotaxis protein CheA [Sphingobium]QDC40104.1 chemotaxis protein CheA [Sphingobium fuliginis ATCC 27551]UXC92880.1 chemotaxis protein CheA [Sphingobium sp. RSMS]
MDELLQQFLLEGRDLVADAHAALVALGRDARDRPALDRLFRATHTLKGSVALFDMAPAERLLHVAEARLEGARKGDGALDEAMLDLLMQAIDQTDRWIDAMEGAASLDADATGLSDRLIALIAGDGETGEADLPLPVSPRVAADQDWIAALRSRAELAMVDPGRARTAFRYTPDPDCFFRGEDPLSMVENVPQLLGIAILPAGDAWPDLATCEPFRCMAAIEGLSAADEAQVRAAFRLAPDQIAVAPFNPSPAASDSAPYAAELAATLRVEAARLDRLADQSGELAVAIRALQPIAARLRAIDPLLAAELRAAEDEIARVAGQLQRSVAQVRLVSLEPVLRRLPRLAREAAAMVDKAIRFTIEGETAQVDKQLADQLFEPLLHLVRNAVDHGLEPAGQRVASGKPAEGRIGLAVRQDGGHISIVLTDDGRGIDPQAMRAAAVAKGLMSGEAAAALSDAEALHIVFLPGFSTAESATMLSGRGVGMDAVRAAVERLAGTIAIQSDVGRGTRITLRLPANAITTPLLVVAAGDRQLGVRLDQIVETARIDASAVQPVGQAHACILRDRTVPVLDLAALLGLEPTSGALARLVVTDAGPCRTALRVAAFGERFDAVVRESTGLLAAMPAVAGTAMMSDGSVLLVLDLPELVA